MRSIIPPACCVKKPDTTAQPVQYVGIVNCGGLVSPGVMSLKAYNDACLRAELFGQPKPDRDEFLEKNKHLDVVEVNEEDVKAAESTAMLDEHLGATSGGLGELNSILGSTQTKLNRLKGVCGSLTNMLRFKLTSKDNLSYSSEPSYVGQANFDSDFIPPKTPELNLGPVNTGLESPVFSQVGVHKAKNEDINSAIDDLKSMQRIKMEGAVSKGAAKDLKQKATSQINKLDELIGKAEHANSSLQHQNKQMRSLLR